MIILELIILGLAFGSFVNALVWRLHQQSMPKKKRAASDNELSITTGRSMCPHCKHSLAWYDLLPVISWFSLRGRCRYCQKHISWQYPLVELATALLFVASYVWWPQTFDGSGVWSLAVWLVCLVGLIALTVYDIKWMLLPNRIVFPLTIVAAVGLIGDVMLFGSGISGLLRAVAAVAIAGGIFYILFQVSDGKWIGGGDVKLGFVLGLLLAQPIDAFMMLFIASILGLMFTLLVVLFKRSAISKKVAFGPFLILATIIVKLFGAGIIGWYTETLLYL
jgi:leader peptidase (prepilin peptidase) / N-methyltransferase